jgi:hypothetical protein
MPFYIQSFHVWVSNFIFRSAILSSVGHFILYQLFYVVSAILYICQLFYHVSAIPWSTSHFMLCQSFPYCVSIFFCVNHYIFLLVILYILSVIFLLIFLCVLQVYYFDNLLSNVPVLAGTPHCQFFISDVIDRISNLDRDVSRDGSVIFGKLPVSITFFSMHSTIFIILLLRVSDCQSFSCLMPFILFFFFE